MTKLSVAVISDAASMYVLSLPGTIWMPKPGLSGGVTALMSGWRMRWVNAVTMLPNAAPITTATARSTTLPRRMKSLKPLIMSAERNGDLLGEGRRRDPCGNPGGHLDQHQ